jgi:hypothetical protein
LGWAVAEGSVSVEAVVVGVGGAEVPTG